MANQVDFLPNLDWEVLYDIDRLTCTLYWKILTLKKRIIGCKFTTRATVLDNRRNTDNRGTTKEWYRGGIQGYFESFEEFRHGLWEGMVNFINGKTCRVSFHLSARYLKMDVI
ncbi:hypothetical protein Hanom_Chr02g00130741 [Helianthus anomalus]